MGTYGRWDLFAFLERDIILYIVTIAEPITMYIHDHGEVLPFTTEIDLFIKSSVQPRSNILQFGG